MSQVAPNRVRNKKYDNELLSPVVKDALAVQGIPEAYEWLEEAVRQADIPVGPALHHEQTPGTMGLMHEIGAGTRVAAAQVIIASDALSDMNLFWQLPLSARADPVAQSVVRPLPNVRYSQPQHVPDDLKHAADPDSDDAPLQSMRKAVRARRKVKSKAKGEAALPKPKARARRKRGGSDVIAAAEPKRKQPKKQQRQKAGAAKVGLTADDVSVGDLLLT